MRLGLGCVDLGTVSGGRPWADDVALIQGAIDAGVQVLDVADLYGNGASERIVGRALHDRREQVVLSTKGGYLFRERSRTEVAARQAAKSVLERLGRARGASRAPSTSTSTGTSRGRPSEVQDFSPTYLRSALRASLERLRTDYVDVYHVHGPPGVIPGLVGELEHLRAAGMVRRFGVGAESVAVAADWVASGQVDVVELPIGILDPEGIDVAAAAAARGVEVWARGVFAGGHLALAERAPAALRDDPKWPLINGLQLLAAEIGSDVFALAMGFVRALPGVSVVLVGTSSPSHLARNLELWSRPPLPAEVVQQIRSLHADAMPGSS